jgi:hypothetical protein
LEEIGCWVESYLRKYFSSKTQHSRISSYYKRNLSLFYDLNAISILSRWDITISGPQTIFLHFFSVSVFFRPNISVAVKFAPFLLKTEI